EPTRGTVFNTYNVHVHRKQENRTILLGNPSATLLFVRHHSGEHSMVNAKTGDILWTLDDENDVGTPIGFTVINEIEWLVLVENGDKTKIAMVHSGKPDIFRRFSIPNSDDFSVKGRMSLSPNGSWVCATISKDKEHGWIAISLLNHRETVSIQSRFPLQGFAWSTDNQQVVCVQRRGMAYIYDFPDGTLVKKFDTDINNGEGDLRWPHHVAYDRQAQQLVLFNLLPKLRSRRPNDRISFKRIDTNTGETLRELRLAHSATRVRLSGDGHAFMAYGPETEGKFYLVDTRTRPIPIICLNTRAQHISSAWFTDDLNQLFTSESGVPRTSNKEDGWPGHECYYELKVDEFLDLRKKSK
ncbi:MAG: hypothetical protein AAGA25_03185, partial [Planctomycetota bacterium]